MENWRTRLLRWYWSLLAAPVVFVGGIALFEACSGPNLPSVFEAPLTAIVAALFTLSLGTLALTLVFFRRITARFAPSPLYRWPLYGAVLAMCLGAMLSALLFQAVFTPLEETTLLTLSAGR